jgi:hypothetical protein
LRRHAALGAGVLCLAGVAVAVAALSEAGNGYSTPASAPGGWERALHLSLILAFVAYVAGVLLLSRHAERVAPVLVLVAGIQLAPLAAPLLFSRDALLYNLLGTVHDPYTGHKDRGGGETYGPLWLIISRPLARLDGGTADSAAYAFRVLAIVCLAGIIALVWKLAARKAFAVALVGWNPLIAFHYAGGGHNDALMMVFVLGALALAAADRAQAGGVSWATAISLKWTAAWFFVLWAIQRFRNRRPIGIAGLLLAGAVLLVVAFSVFGVEWLRAFRNLSHQERIDHPSLGMLGWLEDLGVPRIPALAAGFLIQVAVFAVFALAAWRRRLHLGLAACALVICAPRIDPWYALWPVSLAAVDDEDRWGRIVAVGLSGFLLADSVTTFVDA